MPTDGGPLRVGVVIDGPTVPRWIDRLLDAIAGAPSVTLAALQVDGAAPHAATGAIAALYRRVDRRVFGGAAPLLARVAINPRAAALPPRAPVEVWLCLGARTTAPDGVAPRLGTWTLHVGGLGTDRADDWAVMDVLLQRGFVPVELRATVDGSPRLLGRSLAQTDGRSPVRAREHVVPSAGLLVLKALDRARAGADALFAGADDRLASPIFDAAPAALGNRQMALSLADHALRIAREHLDRIAYDTSWALAWQLDPSFPSARPFHLAMAPADRFWADPFVGFDHGRRYLFFEELRYARPTGEIAMMALDDRGRPGAAEVVLTRPYHLSFPFVFARGGDHFMIPETSGAGQIELYRARRFPHDWELVEVLMPATNAADVTLLEHGGRWWMFADLAKDGTKVHSETLHLFHAADPLGPWTPHRANPVAWSVEHARPAGAVFRVGADLIRPAQDCKDAYGRATVLHQITELTPDRYRERVVQTLHADWDPRITGVHTFNRQGDVTVIDCKLRIPR